MERGERGGKSEQDPSVTGRDGAETPRDREAGRLSGHDEIFLSLVPPSQLAFAFPNSPPVSFPVVP